MRAEASNAKIRVVGWVCASVPLLTILLASFGLSLPSTSGKPFPLAYATSPFSSRQWLGMDKQKMVGTSGWRLTDDSPLASVHALLDHVPHPCWEWGVAVHHVAFAKRGCIGRDVAGARNGGKAGG